MSNDCAVLVLEGYMMALIKQENSFYLFDPHARDANGMPHSNGTAIILKFETVVELEQHLCLLSMNLHVNAFEIVGVQLTLLSAKQKSLKNIEYLERKRSEENEYEKQIRLQKANDYKKFKLTVRDNYVFKTKTTMQKKTAVTRN